MHCEEKTRFPPPVFETRRLDEERQVVVIRDDALPGGTKERGLDRFCREHNADEFIYATSPHGFAQVALAAACHRCAKRATLFVQGRSETDESVLTRMARQKFGARCFYVRGPLLTLQRQAQDYAARSRRNNFVFPFGLMCDEFLQCLEEEVGKVMMAYPEPKRLWLVGGSGALCKVMRLIFPNTTLMIVQIGRSFGVPDFNCQLFVAPEEFWQPAEQPPPFPSASRYDAKVWRFVLKHAQDGDHVWNVAAEPPMKKKRSRSAERKDKRRRR